MKQIPQFLLAAPASGSGKTTVSRGLMALLTRKGLRVQPFKCGPDYIDTKYHEAVCHCPSVNIDSFMASANHIRSLYAHYAHSADAVVVEGMMGLYDGYQRDLGSSAEISVLLKLPVVLVVDAKSAAYSLAPLLNGFLHFNENVEIAGVIFNRVGSEKHYQTLCEICEELSVTCFGYLPKQRSLEQHSRHLGLDFTHSQATEGVASLADLMEQYINLPLLLEKCTRELPEQDVSAHAAPKAALHIAVARSDESFSFIYAEHLALLSRLGEVTFFNPEADEVVPAATDLLYLPGGYPEERAAQLAVATRAKESIRQYVENGGKTLAECGGMIYLSKGLLKETYYPMVGVLPFRITARTEERKLALGYRQFVYRGLPLKGHEFHYTTFADRPPASVAQLYNARKEPVATPVFRYKNLIASYTHLYWGETDLMKLFND